MYHDDQITLKRQRWSCVVENLTLWRFNSSACSTSAIWRGCLQLHVMATLLDITILPVPAEHVLLALHLLLVIRSQVCKTGLETLFQHRTDAAFSAHVVLQHVPPAAQSGFWLPSALLNSHPLPCSPPDGNGFALQKQCLRIILYPCQLGQTEGQLLGVAVSFLADALYLLSLSCVLA